MNKKGSLVLRDIMFMLIIFSAIMALASLFVLDMAREYTVTDMETEYTANGSIGSLGTSVFSNVNESVSGFVTQTEEGIGSWNLITGAIQGIGAVLKGVLLAPVYVKTAVTTMMVALKIPNIIAVIIGNLIMISIYVVIIFVIMSAFLRGGKV